jgi:FK506-binding protein 2
MRLSFISALVALAIPVLAADPEPLEIEVTKKVECDRKTVKGDRIDVHYRGTLVDG